MICRCETCVCEEQVPPTEANGPCEWCSQESHSNILRDMDGEGWI